MSSASTVLHVFEKKTQKTARVDIDLGKRRYRLALERRGRSKESEA